MVTIAAIIEGPNKCILHASGICILNLCKFPTYINSNWHQKSKRRGGGILWGEQMKLHTHWWVLSDGRPPGSAVCILSTALRRLCFSQGGVFYFLEHVADDHSSWRYFWQQVCYPTWKLVFDGCCLTREIWKNLEQANFSELKLQHISVPLPGTPIKPHIIGYAVK